MSLPLLEDLVRLMAQNELTNVELQDGEQRIVLSRGPAGGMGMMPMMPQIPMQAMAAPGQMPGAMPSSPSATAAPPSSTPGAAEPGAPAAGAAEFLEVKSPMVGTYYASPSPDAKPFVQVGDRVNADTDVCIIEAMKVFNNIKAEVNGTIEKIMAENGQAVEYGQVLFLVRPS